MRAVVFSGGGMFGAYHVGAWKVLSKVFEPDLVVGTSVGSLNAYMVAGGASVADLEKHWLEGESLAQPVWRMPWRFGDGFADPAAAHQVMQLMCRELRPKRKLAIVARKFWTQRPRIFLDGEITWRHLAASCAIPFVFGMQRINGELCSDGGVLDPLPLFAARDLGATEIIGINCMTWGGFGVTARLTVRPRKRLGVIPRDVLYWNRERTERWIEQGERDARAFEELARTTEPDGEG